MEIMQWLGFLSDALNSFRAHQRLIVFNLHDSFIFHGFTYTPLS
jgi:hypothetical protein